MLCQICALSVVLAFSSAPSGPEVRERLAEQFASWFAAGDFAPMFTLAADELRAAMSVEQLGQIRDGLLALHGPLQKVGPATWEDRVQQYMRYRVPLTFTLTILDLRLAFDSHDRVAGMFVVEHVPPRATEQPPVPEIAVTVGDAFTGLPGSLTVPLGEGRFPAVVIVHGSGPLDRDGTVAANRPYRDLAWGLAERGVAALRYDKRSYARPDDLVALGEAVTVDEEIIGDALAALELLRNRPEIDATALFILGHSLGGTVAPRIARRAAVKGVIVLAGATRPLPEMMLAQSRAIAWRDSVITDAERERLAEIEREVSTLRAGLNGERPLHGLHLGAPLGYYRDLEAHDPPFELARSKLPCLVLGGSRDEQVTAEDFSQWQRALEGQPRACLQWMEGIDHLLRRGEGRSSPAYDETAGRVDAEILDRVARWIVTGRCAP